MKIVIISLILLLSLFLEGTLIRLPLVLLVLLSLVVLYKTQAMFFLALFLGILLDSLLMRPLGQTSLFYVVFLGIIFLYSQKFELKTISFILVMSFFGSVWYLLLFGHQLFFVQLPVSVGIGAFFFVVLSWVNQYHSQKTHEYTV